MEKKMKKILVSLLVAAMTMTMLAGCGTKETENTDETTTSETATGSHNLKDINVDDYVLELGEYKGLQLVATKQVVTDEHVTVYIDNMLQNNPKRVEITDRAVQTGDVVNLDYAGTENGVAFDGGTAQGSELTIGSGTFILGFEDGMIGMNIGETKDINLTFPENYKNTDLAGKAVVFKVTVNSIYEEQPQELNDEFVKGLGIDNCNDVESLKVEVRKALENYAESTYQSDLQQVAIDALLDKSKFAENPPEALVEYCKQELSVDFENQLAEMGLTLENYLQDYGEMSQEQYDIQLTEGAKSAANLKMACMKIALLENITVSEDELNQAIEENYANLGYASADDYKQNGSPEDYKDFLLLNKVREFLVSNAVITTDPGTEATQTTTEAATTEETTETETATTEE